MTKININKLISSIQKGQKAISNLTVFQKHSLEKVWDVEHAYYSSALEGSKIDRKEFEKFAKGVA
jgi:hypothetical protein